MGECPHAGSVGCWGGSWPCPRLWQRVAALLMPLHVLHVTAAALTLPKANLSAPECASVCLCACARVRARSSPVACQQSSSSSSRRGSCPAKTKGGVTVGVGAVWCCLLQLLCACSSFFLLFFLRARMGSGRCGGHRVVGLDGGAA